MKPNKKHLKQHGNKRMKKEQSTIEQAQNEFKDAQIFVSKKSSDQIESCYVF